MSNEAIYIFKATRRSNKNNYHETVGYECSLCVKIRENINNTFFNKEHKMYLKDELSSFFVYEIEINNVQITANSRLEKSRDFLRRLYYRYDWIIAKALKNGYVISIENLEELKTNWHELKNIILSSYCGGKVENYLEHLNNVFQQNTIFEVPFSQYLYFGLLFPPIPVSHKPGWTGVRKIQLSDFEKESFEETITYLSTSENGRRRYKITAEALPGSVALLESFKGNVTRSPGNLHVDQAQAEAIYNYNDQKIEWAFELEMNELNPY